MAGADAAGVLAEHGQCGRPRRAGRSELCPVEDDDPHDEKNQRGECRAPAAASCRTTTNAATSPSHSHATRQPRYWYGTPTATRTTTSPAVAASPSATAPPILTPGFARAFQTVHAARATNQPKVSHKPAA